VEVLEDEVMEDEGMDTMTQWIPQKPKMDY